MRLELVVLVSFRFGFVVIARLPSCLQMKDDLDEVLMKMLCDLLTLGKCSQRFILKDLRQNNVSKANINPCNIFIDLSRTSARLELEVIQGLFEVQND